MEPIDIPAESDTPYRFPSRHPSVGRGTHPSRDGTAQDGPEGSSIPATIAPDTASEIKRRQEALLLTYLIHQPARYSR